MPFWGDMLVFRRVCVFVLFLSGGVLLEKFQLLGRAAAVHHSASAAGHHQTAAEDDATLPPYLVGMEQIGKQHIWLSSISTWYWKECVYSCPLYPMSWKNTDRIRKKQLRGWVWMVSVLPWNNGQQFMCWHQKKVMSTGNEFTGFAGKSCTNIWSLNMSCDLRRSLVDKSCLLENSSLAECWEYVRHVVAPVPVLVPRVRARQSVSTHHFHGINNTVSFDHAGHKQAHAVTMNMYPGIMCANFTNINSWILKIAQRFKCQKKTHPRWKRNKISHWSSLPTWEELELGWHPYGCFQK